MTPEQVAFFTEVSDQITSNLSYVRMLQTINMTLIVILIITKIVDYIHVTRYLREAKREQELAKATLAKTLASQEHTEILQQEHSQILALIKDYAFSAKVNRKEAAETLSKVESMGSANREVITQAVEKIPEKTAEMVIDKITKPVSQSDRNG